MITKQQLKNVCIYATDANIDKYLPHLNILMDKYEINTPNRRRHFIAQIAHESGQFKYVKEGYSGENYDTGWLAKLLGNTPEKDGDGEKYKGRGLIQITGKENYLKASIAIYNSDYLIFFPEVVEQPYTAVEVSCWFWKDRHLNSLADLDQIRAITLKINGGLNGFLERQYYYNLAKKYII